MLCIIADLSPRERLSIPGRGAVVRDVRAGARKRHSVRSLLLLLLLLLLNGGPLIHMAHVAVRIHGVDATVALAVTVEVRVPVAVGHLLHLLRLQLRALRRQQRREVPRVAGRALRGGDSEAAAAAELGVPCQLCRPCCWPRNAAVAGSSRQPPRQERGVVAVRASAVTAREGRRGCALTGRLMARWSALIGMA